MMLPDFDNTQKWLEWIRSKPLFTIIWSISPIALLIVAALLWNQNGKLKGELQKTRNDLIPIRQLYPKLELSAAVVKLLENHNQLKAEVDLAKQKELQKRFVSLSQNRVAEFEEGVHNLVTRHTDIKFQVKVNSVNPSNDLFRKCKELVGLFMAGGINAEYANTSFSSEHDLVIKCSEALKGEIVKEIGDLLEIVFKKPLHFEYLRSGGKEGDGVILIFFLGTPSFDNEGSVFYDTPTF